MTPLQPKECVEELHRFFQELGRSYSYSRFNKYFEIIKEFDKGDEIKRPRDENGKDDLNQVNILLYAIQETHMLREAISFLQEMIKRERISKMDLDKYVDILLNNNAQILPLNNINAKNGENTPRDHLSDLYIGKLLLDIGMPVDKGKYNDAGCDFNATFENIEIRIECKRVTGYNSVNTRIKNAVKQINNPKSDKEYLGVITLNVSNLDVMKEHIKVWNKEKADEIKQNTELVDQYYPDVLEQYKDCEFYIIDNYDEKILENIADYRFNWFDLYDRQNSCIIDNYMVSKKYNVIIVDSFMFWAENAQVGYYYKLHSIIPQYELGDKYAKYLNSLIEKDQKRNSRNTQV